MKTVAPEVSFPKIEDEVLQEWQKNKTFQKQNQWRESAKEFAFYDGPPFANGLPHYGHLLANTIKDTVPRYWIMRGFKVNRRFGWDCHGLPVEFEIEKREKLKGRPDILKLGISQFNEMCRESVLHYAEEWKKTITRMGRWVDWDDQYRTMDLDFMESVWWVFGELYKKGLVYQGFKIVPYSPRTGSVVSNFEANQNYKDVQDPSVTVKFKLKDEDAWILSWTTTPWTLPSNLALAIGEDIEYVKIKDNESGEHWILAKARLDALYPSKKGKKSKAEAKPYELIESIKSSDLAGKSYKPMFPFFKDQPNAFIIILADFVSTEDGTGIVHQAPAFGEDDYLCCRKHNIDLVDPIDDNGCFTSQVPAYKGLNFKEADKHICKDLREIGVLLRHETLVHSYPFDERTDTPLIYKAVPSWYVAVEKFVSKLVENNKKINWVPSHIKEGRMGSWLQNARDWAISRNRFWGTPLPVWVCENDKEHLEVVASVKDLESKTGEKIDDIHKHFISKLSFSCSQCSGSMKAVDVVFDCWFESGSMPYAQLHYPHENKERFASIFPADFVAEGLDQTRGWFYTLNVLSNALFDKPAFKNVIVNGVILDENGKKMSKRHRNYTPPDELIAKYGADSVRLYMLNSSLLRAENLIFTDKGVKDVTRAVLLPLWNAYSFLSTYAESDEWKPSAKLSKAQIPHLENDLDRWIVSRLQSLVEKVHNHMEEYKLYQVVPPVVDFIEDLTNWYIRLSRRRFWGDPQVDGLSPDQQQAYSTLFYVLLEFSKIFAPFAPFISDRIYNNLLNSQAESPESVHLCDMPVMNEKLQDISLESDMDLLRRATNLGRSLRQQHKIKIRQVLPSMLVITHKESDRSAIQRGSALLKSELNIKQIDFTTEEAKHVRLSLKPNLKTLGRRLGKNLNVIRQHLTELNKSHEKVSKLLQDLAEQGSIDILGHCLTLEDFLVDRGPLDDRLIATEMGVTVLLDTNLTPELVAEGYARELVNRIQNLRKDSQLNISDRILLQVLAPEKLVTAVESYQDYILRETLGTSLNLIEGGGECDLEFTQSYEIEGMNCVIALETVSSHS
ncbi:MAG: isoleucine--tRNA ligase [Oligoflexales bacterium]